jgi:hypothetical protein
MGVMFLMYGFSTLVVVVYIRNALRYRGGGERRAAPEVGGWARPGAL